jgi:hypothetical protein
MHEAHVDYHSTTTTEPPMSARGRPQMVATSLRSPSYEHHLHRPSAKGPKHLKDRSPSKQPVDYVHVTHTFSGAMGSANKSKQKCCRSMHPCHLDEETSSQILAKNGTASSHPAAIRACGLHLQVIT